MPSAALQAFRRTVTVDWPKTMDREAKALLLKTARDGHAEIMRAQGNPAFEAYANRPGNSNLASVVLPGPIVYRYDNLRALAAFALDELRKTSPVRSGDYVRSHMLFVNGVAVPELPEALARTDVIMIANPVPYARRLEIGKTNSGRDFLVSVPNRIYERVTKQKLMPRYRNVAKISFEYIIIPDAYRYRNNNAARSWLANKGRWYVSPKQRADRAAGAAVKSPAIVIRALT